VTYEFRSLERNPVGVLDALGGARFHHQGVTTHDARSTGRRDLHYRQVNIDAALPQPHPPVWAERRASRTRGVLVENAVRHGDLGSRLQHEGLFDGTREKAMPRPTTLDAGPDRFAYMGCRTTPATRRGALGRGDLVAGYMRTGADRLPAGQDPPAISRRRHRQTDARLRAGTHFTKDRRGRRHATARVGADRFRAPWSMRTPTSCTQRSQT